MEDSAIGALQYPQHQHMIAGDIRVRQDGTFQMYLNFLDKWESSLLQDIDVKYPICQIITELSQGNFLIAMDRSSGSNSMSFGWKICTTQGHTLVQHADNESIITRIQQQKDYLYDYPFNTLASDWDIIAQIVTVLNESKFNDDFEYLKGHQDRDK
eukprot:10910127-Ditylum_brightwellii.AAC.1